MSGTADHRGSGKLTVASIIGDALNVPKCFWVPGTASMFHSYVGSGAIAGFGQGALVAGPGPFPFTSQMYGVNNVVGSHITNGVRITNGVDLMTGGVATIVSAVWKCLSANASINSKKIEIAAGKSIEIAAAKNINMGGAKGVDIYSGTKVSIDSTTVNIVGSTATSITSSTGNLSGTWTYNMIPICASPDCSDIILKKDIKPLENSLSKILKLQGVTFNWDEKIWPEMAKENPKSEIGFIAQEVEKVLPEVIKEISLGICNENGDKENKMVKRLQYQNVVALLVEGMKDQQKQIDDLKDQIKNLSQ